MIKHNKKRNVGIIYELLLRYISNCLIEDKKDLAQKGLTIIEKRFNKDTELYKEFRLFNALAKTTVSGSNVAAAILQEAKSAIKRCDEKKLMKEKSRLIKDINYKLGDKEFYHRKIPDYVTYATIHNLFNEWKKCDKSNLTQVFKYEKNIMEWLLNENKIVDSSEVLEADSLIFKIMTKKLNERYDKFNIEQKEILQNYALHSEENKHDKMREFLRSLKEQTLLSIKDYKHDCDSDVVRNKIATVVENVNNLDVTTINDELITKFLMLSKLKEELRS